ncbi:MAG TPA: hypothetical protein V6C58_08660 [Allocoleopsis sp.]
MVNQWHNTHYLPEEKDQVENELLELILTDYDDYYPWNPAEITSEGFFTAQEEILYLDDLEIKQRSQSFFAKLDKLWGDTENTLTTFLYSHFTKVPQSLLEAIAHKAEHIFMGNLPLMEKLVQCVSPVLPNWGEDDLMVLARPLAYNMRNKRAEQTTLANLSNADWEELSELERVRLTIAIARFALNELKKD